ncbi:hypothetical protein POTOM_024565 [Populus tomentosa]|uniref:KIB1-4 beta-propeller domain-containing protein n=1 Tax=Populus tomentosa TaxID=118781 RepID=A0A8X8CWK9_POPTO|nr:hypothetical protein POTOM_024565 [Populus tomentosa]
MEILKDGQRDWAQVPADILEYIASKVSVAGYHRFLLVCTAWRRTTSMRPPSSHLPWLMLSNDRNKKTRRFFCLHDSKFYQIPLPRVVRRSWCAGSSYGWFIMAHKTRGDFLFNPFSGVRIPLPTHYQPSSFVRPASNPYFMTKAILSSEPTPENIAAGHCLVAALFEVDSLGICRPGDQAWTCFTIRSLNGDGEFNKKDDEDDSELEEYESIKGDYEDVQEIDDDGQAEEDDNEEEIEEGLDDEEETVTTITDITFYRGKLYAISYYNAIYICDEARDGSIAWRRLDTLPLNLKKKERGRCDFKYLVESNNGELLMVVRVRDHGFTIQFIVFKLDDETSDPAKWVRLENIGNQIIFLGRNHTKCVPAIDFPGFEGNCVYYSCDLWNHFRVLPMDQRDYADMGVYGLGRRVKEEFFPENYGAFMSNSEHSFKYLGLSDGPSSIDNDSMLIYPPLIAEVECLLNFASIITVGRDVGALEYYYTVAMGKSTARD